MDIGHAADDQKGSLGETKRQAQNVDGFSSPNRRYLGTLQQDGGATLTQLSEEAKIGSMWQNLWKWRSRQGKGANGGE